MELNHETRARLSKLINRIADNVDDLRSLAISILSEDTEVVSLDFPDFSAQGAAQDETSGDPRPVLNVAPMQKSAHEVRSYSEILRPRRQSRRAIEGKIATYELAKAMRLEFPEMDTRRITAVCRKLGITVYQHSHASYVMCSLADIIANYIRSEKEDDR